MTSPRVKGHPQIPHFQGAQELLLAGLQGCSAPKGGGQAPVFARNCKEWPQHRGKNVFLWKKLLGKRLHLQSPKAETPARALEQNRGTNHFIPSSWRILPCFPVLWAREAEPQCWERAPQFIPRIKQSVCPQFLKVRLFWGALGFIPAARISWRRCLQP